MSSELKLELKVVSHSLGGKCCLQLSDFDKAIIVLVKVADQIVHLERSEARCLEQEMLERAYVNLLTLFLLRRQEVVRQLAYKLDLF